MKYFLEQCKRDDIEMGIERRGLNEGTSCKIVIFNNIPLKRTCIENTSLDEIFTKVEG